MRTREILSIFSLIIALSPFNTACKDENKYKKEIAQLDSMLLNLVKITADSSLTKTNDSLITYIQHDLSVIDTLVPDTISVKQLAILLMEYRSLTTPLKQGPLRMEQLRNEATEASKRIANLKNDLAKDIADEKLAGSFVEAEKNNTNTLLGSFSLLNSIRDSIFKKADAEKEMIKGKIRELEIIKKEKKKHNHLH